MATRINLKEILSWLVLLFAIILLSSTILYAQDVSSDANSKISIRISKEENGKVTKLDTTFDFSDEKTIERLLEKFSSDEEGVTIKRDKKDKDQRLKIRAEISSEKDGKLKEMEKEINISLSDLESQIKESLSKFEEFHFDFNHDFPDNFSFDFKFSDDKLKAGFDADKENFFGNDSIHWKSGCQSKHSGWVADSILSDEYIVIGAEEDEQTPVFEKEITHSDGSKSFVFKRSLKESKTSKKNNESVVKGEEPETLPGLRDLQIFPNPSSGKITISFNSEDEAKTDILILDSSASAKIKMTVKDEIGAFEKKFDLSKYGSGTYILKISRSGKSITKKLIVE